MEIPTKLAERVRAAFRTTGRIEAIRAVRTPDEGLDWPGCDFATGKQIVDEVCVGEEHPVFAPAPRATGLEWGLTAAVPAGAPVAWGARAVFTRTGMDLDTSRQSLVGEEPHVAALLTLLNEAGRMAVAQKKYVEAVEAGRVRRDEAGYVVLDRFDDVYTFAINTNGSCGYVYVAAWIAPPPDLSKVEHVWSGGPARFPAPGEVLWSHPGPIPAVGEVVVSRCNNIGRCTVLGYGVTDGWLYLLAWPLDPPAWYRKQNGTEGPHGVRTWSPCGVFGADLPSVVDAPAAVSA